MSETPKLDPHGCVATFKNQQESDWLGRPGSVLCSHFEQLVDELNLLPNIRTAHPPRLTLPDHVNCLISLDRSPRRVEFTKALLRLEASFDRPMKGLDSFLDLDRDRELFDLGAAGRNSGTTDGILKSR